VFAMAARVCRAAAAAASQPAGESDQTCAHDAPALMPPCAATVWERVGNSLVMQLWESSEQEGKHVCWLSAGACVEARRLTRFRYCRVHGCCGCAPADVQAHAMCGCCCAGCAAVHRMRARHLRVVARPPRASLANHTTHAVLKPPSDRPTAARSPAPVCGCALCSQQQQQRREWAHAARRQARETSGGGDRLPRPTVVPCHTRTSRAHDHGIVVVVDDGVLSSCGSAAAGRRRVAALLCCRWCRSRWCKTATAGACQAQGAAQRAPRARRADQQLGQHAHSGCGAK
jgi:hypothetical protein